MASTRQLRNAILTGVGAGAGFWAVLRLWSERRREQRRLPLTIHLPAPVEETQLTANGSIQFIGTATILLRYAGFTILTDPNFLHSGERIHMAYGLVSATRQTDPALEVGNLPKIDFVVLSHNHEDHFDRVAAGRLEKTTPIITTRDAARLLRRKGFQLVYSLATWQYIDLRKSDATVRVTAMPGRHGPLLLRSVLPSVNGHMLDFGPVGDVNPLRVYLSGDTLVHRRLREIPRRYPGVDIAVLHLGGTRVLGVLMSMDGKQGLEALRIIAPRVAILVHYNDYDIFRSPLDHFASAVREAGLEDRVVYLTHGETYEFTAPEIQRPEPALIRT
ncbi:MAG: MBL fold metallo-hydrolase [Bryobacteraceae bacterium]